MEEELLNILILRYILSIYFDIISNEAVEAFIFVINLIKI